MIMTAGSWTSRLAALAILLLVILAGYRFLLTPALELHVLNEQRAEQMRALLQRYQTLAASKAGLAERLEDVEGRGEAASGYWAGPSEALAAAQLQDRASQAITAHGGEVISVQIIRADQPEDEGSAQRAELGLRLSATIDALAAIMHDMETAMPYMFIDRLVIGAARTRRNEADTPGGASTLDVGLDVFGYLRPADRPQADQG